MSKRVESLNKLREYVEQGENARYYYAVEDSLDEKTCYCAVGYLAHLYGVSDEELSSAGTQFLGMTDGTSCIINALSPDFKEKELHHLQCCNDDTDTETIIAHIDELIAKTMKEGE